MTPQEIMKIREMGEEGYKKMATRGALAGKISVKMRQIVLAKNKISVKLRRVAMTLKKLTLPQTLERLKARKRKRRRRRRV